MFRIIKVGPLILDLAILSMQNRCVCVCVDVISCVLLTGVRVGSRHLRMRRRDSFLSIQSVKAAVIELVVENFYLNSKV